MSFYSIFSLLCPYPRSSFASQVRECAGVLRPLVGCVQVRDKPLSDPVCVRVGGDPGSLSSSHRATLQSTLFAKWLSCHWRTGLFAHACCPCWWGGHCVFVFTECYDRHAYIHFILTCTLSLDYPSVLSGLAMVGKFGITASFAVIYVYTAEIFPTVLR